MKKSSKKVRVIVIEHQLNTGKVAKFGDVIDVAHLNGNLRDLVDQKFVEEVDPDKDSDDSKGDNTIDIGRLNKNDLMAHATDLGVEFDPSNTKNEIIKAINAQNS